MHAELAVAGLLCLSLAAGHAGVGRRILPSFRQDQLPGTPFGPPPVTLSIVLFSWHAMTLTLLTFTGLLLSLAWDPGADPRTLSLRWLAGAFLAATATAVWLVRRRLRTLLRVPMPFAFVVIAILCWISSSRA